MKVRSCLLLLLVVIGCAGAAEPKARPRLTPPVVSEVKREAAQPALDAGSAPHFLSFDDFLQAEARRPVGLEAVRETSAARSEAGSTENKGQTSKDSQPTPSRPDPGGAEVLVLPKVEITAERMTKLEAQLAGIDQQQRGEEKTSETTVLDTILNPPFLNLGGGSPNARAAMARRRIEVLRWVTILTISLGEAKTPGDKARIQADIDGLKDITRKWP